MEIKAAAIQFNVQQGELDANLAYVRDALARVAAQGAQLAVLPEMWSTGFAYRNLAELAQQTEAVVAELQELSARHRLVIVGSQPEPAGDGRVYNTAHVIDNGRLVTSYRKLHLFSLLGEDKAFKGGGKKGEGVEDLDDLFEPRTGSLFEASDKPRQSFVVERNGNPAILPYVRPPFVGSNI